MNKNSKVYKTILEYASDGVFIMNSKGELLDFSNTVPLLLGYTPDELSNKTVFDWDINLTKEEYQNIIDTFSDTPIIFERIHTRKDGTTYIAEINLTATIYDNDELLIYASVRDITEQKNIRIELNKSHELINRLSDQIPGVIYQYQYFPDGSSCFPYASEHIFDIYEVTPSEVMENASIVFSRIHPDDLQNVSDSIIKSYEDLTPWNCDYRVVLPKKGLRWVRGSANPERLEDLSVIWHGYISDITQLKKMESELNDSFRSIQLKNEKINSLLEQQNIKLETQLKKILGSSLNGIQYFKAVRNDQNKIIDFEFVFSNEVACDIIQKTEKEVIGKRLLEIIPNHTDIIKEYGKSLFEMYCEVVETGASKDLMFRFDGSNINDWFSNKVVKLEDGFVVNFTIITDLIESIKLEKLNIELKKQVEIEVAKNNQKEKLLLNQKRFADMGQMINAIAHQWRQPINNMYLTSQMLQQLDEGNDYGVPREDLYEQQEKLIEYMSKTIDDFKNYFSSEGSDHNFSLLEEINESIKLLRAQFNSYNIDVSIRHNQSVNESFIYYGSAAKFRQVFMNIISNAKDAILDSQLNGDKKIDINLSKESNHIHLKVENTGDHISADHMLKIFNPYFTTKEEGNGTGIGLYMSKLMIEKEMKGKISAENTPNGVAFHIKLPGRKNEKS